MPLPVAAAVVLELVASELTASWPAAEVDGAEEATLLPRADAGL